MKKRRDEDTHAVVERMEMGKRKYRWETQAHTKGGRIAAR